MHNFAQNPNDGDGTVDIVDNFGRTKKVQKNSREYADYLVNTEVEKTKSNLYGSNLESSSSSSDGNTEWAWSNGQTHSESGEWLKDLVTERGLKSLVDQKVEKEIEISSISNEAKVKTMYQKTLQSSARNYLKEVHEDSVLNRSIFTEKSTLNTSRVDDRREMLRLKKLQQKNKS